MNLALIIVRLLYQAIYLFNIIANMVQKLKSWNQVSNINSVSLKHAYANITLKDAIRLY